MAIEAGDWATGLRYCDRAHFHGAGAQALSWKAYSLMGLNRPEEAAVSWSAALDVDPDNANAYLGRARCMRQIGLWENALADLGAPPNESRMARRPSLS